MAKKLYIKRHHLIINRIRKSPCSFKEILDSLRHYSQFSDEDYEISKRTFERDLIEISEIYDIEIQYNRSLRKYEIAGELDGFKTERIIEAFEIYDFLSLSGTFSEFVLPEKRKPMATEFLKELLYAVKHNFIVEFEHTKFADDRQEFSQRKVHPLALKEAIYRWYLVAYDPVENEVKTFGLERIQRVVVTNQKFKMENIPDLKAKFENAFGIITDGTKPEKIILEVSAEQMPYLKTLPLHHSQTILSENQIQLFLSPTYDFLMEILSMGKEVKINEPKSLQKEIIKMLELNLKNYKD